MLLERDGNKLRAFCLYRDSDMYTLGTRISDFDEDSGVARQLDSLINTGRRAYRGDNPGHGNT